MVTKEKCNKDIEQRKHKNMIKRLPIICNQVLIELKNKHAEIIMLKKGNGKSNVRHEARKDKRNESG